MSKKIFFYIEEVLNIYEIEQTFLLQCIDNEWIKPSTKDPLMLDQEDISRVLLINDLTETMGANKESIPIILHLVDQLHYLKNQIKKFSKEV